VLPLRRGDVGGELDDLHRLARGIEHGIVGCLDPDLAAALGDPLVLGGLELTAPQILPERAVSRALALRRLDEQAVMTAADLIQRVAIAVRKFALASRMVPSSANSIVASDRLKAASLA